jgi:transcriptional regulator with XRE-family HTH domain
MSNRQRTPEEFAINTTVGRNIKYLRKTRNLNQSKVAAALGTSFQQIQKYEKGANGCSAIRLKQLSDFFKVGTDVLMDPQMITAHRGFTGNMDWLEDKKTPQDAGYLKPQKDIGSLEEIKSNFSGVDDDDIKMIDEEHFNRQLNK